MDFMCRQDDSSGQTHRHAAVILSSSSQGTKKPLCLLPPVAPPRYYIMRSPYSQTYDVSAGPLPRYFSERLFLFILHCEERPANLEELSSSPRLSG